MNTTIYEARSRQFALDKDKDKFSPFVHYVIGLNEEAGEVAGLLKRWIRDDKPILEADLKSELGDVLWYLTQLASVYGISLEDLMISNLEKLEKRYSDDIDTSLLDSFGDL